MQRKIKTKQVCPACCLLFMAVDNIDILNGDNYIFIGNTESCTRHTENFTPENCPIVLQVIDKNPDDTQYAITAHYQFPTNTWITGEQTTQKSEAINITKSKKKPSKHCYSEYTKNSAPNLQPTWHTSNWERP